MTPRYSAIGLLVVCCLATGRSQDASATPGTLDKVALDGMITGSDVTINGTSIHSFSVKLTATVSTAAVTFVEMNVALHGPITGTITEDNVIPSGTIDKTKLKFAGTIGGTNVDLSGEITAITDRNHLMIQGTLTGKTIRPPPVSPIDKFFTNNGLVLRQSVYDQTLLQKPAAFQWVKPAGTTSSYAIDAGLTWNIMKCLANTAEPLPEYLVSHFVLGPSVEYHRNTQIKAPQDSFEAGLTLLYQGGGTRHDELGYYLQTTAQYTDDRINTGKGTQLLLSGTPILQDWAMGGVANGKWWDPDCLQWMWQPVLGIQYASADDVFKTNTSGEVGRLKGNAALGVYPWGHALRKQIEGDVRETYWYDEAQESAYDDRGRGHNLFEASATFWLDVAQNAGIGIDYMRGENPEQGFTRQETTTLSFKAKF